MSKERHAGTCRSKLTLLIAGRLVWLVRFGFSFIWDLVGDRAGHIQLVDVQAGLAEWGHGRVHACIAIGGAAQGSQVQRLAPGDDGDVQGELPPAVGG